MTSEPTHRKCAVLQHSSSVPTNGCEKWRSKWPDHQTSLDNLVPQSFEISTRWASSLQRVTGIAGSTLWWCLPPPLFSAMYKWEKESLDRSWTLLYLALGLNGILEGHFLGK